MGNTLRYCPWHLKEIPGATCPECDSPARGPEDVSPVPDGPFWGRKLDDRYRVTKHLGTGGMGTVYRAWDWPVGTMVAIKFLGRDPDCPPPPEVYQRFREEARILARLRTHRCVTFLDFEGLGGGTPYIVMELLRGFSVGEYLAAQGRMKPAAAILHAIHVCEALEEAHGLGVLHRDLKPANLFLASMGEGLFTMKVLDFGIARILGDHAGRQFRNGEVTVTGTPEYMSPEQVCGQATHAESDLYSLGVVLFEMLTGQVPFTGSTEEVAAAHVNREAPELPEDLAVPRGLRTLVRSLLRKRPADRPSSAAEVRGRLRDLLVQCGSPGDAF